MSVDDAVLYQHGVMVGGIISVYLFIAYLVAAYPYLVGSDKNEVYHLIALSVICESGCTLCLHCHICGIRQ